MVDDTLIPLYWKPSFYKETLFDQKSNYSINVQIMNISNCKIINYASRFQGSRHNTHYFASTKLGKNLSQYLEKDKWY